MNTFIQSLKQLIFPQLCLHCHHLLKPNQSIFCSDCFNQLELIDPATRCSACFCFHPHVKKAICLDCTKHPQLLTAQAAAFEYIGPAATMIKKMKYGNLPFLAKGASAFLIAQFIKLEWPMPDVIIPTPISWTHKIERGFNQSDLIATEMGKALKCPVSNFLKRTAGDYSQAGLSLTQRKKLSAKGFKLNQYQNLEGRNILLVDDVMTSGSTLECCAEALMELFPAAIYGLTVCKTDIKEQKPKRQFHISH